MISPHKQSDLERTFETLWRQLDGPPLESEYQFDPRGKWRFDFAHIPTKIAIELEGGTWSNGRHVRGAGYSKDCAKYNIATLAGWRVFRFTADMLRSDPAGYLHPVIALIRQEVTV